MDATRPMSTMSDREIAEETLAHLRILGQVLSALGSNPMAGMLIPGGVPALNSAK